MVRLKIQIAVPRWFLLLVATGFALTVALAVFLPLALYMVVVVGWFAAVWILFARWSRASIGPRLEQALVRGERRPYVELNWPRSVEKLARTWVVLFAVSAVIGLIVLIVAAIELRFGWNKGRALAGAASEAPRPSRQLSRRAPQRRLLRRGCPDPLESSAGAGPAAESARG